MRGFKEMHAEWWRFAREVEGLGTIRGANRLSGELAGNYRVDLLYNRGPLVLHQLRTLVGDQRFFGIMKEWMRKAEKGPSDTAQLAAAATQVLGQDMAWYFDQWLDQTTIPEIEVQHQLTQTEAGGAVLRGRVIQHGSEFYKLHVPLVLTMPGNKTEVRLVFQQSPTQEFEFALPAVPSKVTVDPAHNNLVEYR
jgi:aminopeptidase N